MTGCALNEKCQMTDSRDNIIVEKSEKFADRITKMYKYLSEKRSGDKDMLKQIVRSGTSVGANVSEGQYAQTKADFLAKYSISLKEASETRYWLELLQVAGYLKKSESTNSIMLQCDELIRLLASSVKKLKADKK